MKDINKYIEELREKDLDNPRKVRVKAMLTQKECAELASVSLSSWQKYEQINTKSHTKMPLRARKLFIFSLKSKLL